MSNKEYNTLNDFIKGKSEESLRKSIAKRIKTYQKDKQEEMKNNSKNTDFNPNKAWNTLHTRIEENGLLSVEKKIFYLSPIAKIAASLILILGITFSAFYLFNSTKYVELASLNEIIEHKLPDGTVVTLNLNSNLKYPESFKGNIREIEFNGEAFFKVAKDTKKPFIINTNKAEVKVLGTSFNLKTNSNDHIELTVTTGKVQLTKKSDLSQKVILFAGDVGMVSKNEISSDSNNNVNYISWKTKKLYFQEGESLNKVISDLNKTYGVNIVFEDNQIGNETINEKTFENRELSFILDAYCTLHSLEYKPVGKNIIISKN